MELTKMEACLQRTVAQSIRLRPEGNNRICVYTPFRFDDGDHFCIVIVRHNGALFFSDEGHTFMHISYDIKVEALNTGKYNRIIQNTLESFGIKQENGALTRKFTEENMGKVFFGYVQGLCKIADVTYLKQDRRQKSNFVATCNDFISTILPSEHVMTHYSDKRIDPQARYPVDCYVGGLSRPLHVYAVDSNGKCRYTTVAIYYYHMQKVEFSSLAIFQDQETIGRQVLAHLTDIVDRQFSSLASNEKVIKQYVNSIKA